MGSCSGRFKDKYIPIATTLHAAVRWGKRNLLIYLPLLANPRGEYTVSWNYQVSTLYEISKCRTGLLYVRRAHKHRSISDVVPLRVSHRTIDTSIRVSTTLALGGRNICWIQWLDVWYKCIRYTTGYKQFQKMKNGSKTSMKYLINQLIKISLIFGNQICSVIFALKMKLYLPRNSTRFPAMHALRSRKSNLNLNF